MIKVLSIEDYALVVNKMGEISLSESILMKAILDYNTSIGSILSDATLDWIVICDTTKEVNYVYFVTSSTDSYSELVDNLYKLIGYKKTYITKQVAEYFELESSDGLLNDTWVELVPTDLSDDSTVKLKKPQLCPEFKRRILMIKPMAMRKEESIHNNKTFDFTAEKVGLNYFKKLVSDIHMCENYTSSIYSFPVLSKKYCQYLVSTMKDVPYKENNAEDKMYQIPEYVIDNDSEEFLAFSSIVFEYINHISMMVYHQKTEHINSIQFARYSASTTYKGNLHSDRDSDITIVINLSDNFIGGGTRILLPGFNNEVIVPPVPIGHCLLFRGRTELHEGLKILSGDRDLLVFWTSV